MGRLLEIVRMSMHVSFKVNGATDGEGGVSDSRGVREGEV
jgi:hypothetical protein